MRIKDKIKRPRRPVVAYEILPPREKDGTLNSYAENISSLLSQTHIDAINIPEVRDEVARGERPIKNQVRAEPREFGRLLQDIVGIEAIVNRVVVHQNIDEEMNGCSLIANNYGLGDDKMGTIAVFGPKRMDYGNIISVVNHTAKKVSKLLSERKMEFNKSL